MSDLPTFEQRECPFCHWTGPYGQSRAVIFMCPECKMNCYMIEALPAAATREPRVSKEALEWLERISNDPQYHCKQEAREILRALSPHAQGEGGK